MSTDSGGTSKAEQERLAAKAVDARQRMEDRAAGRRSIPSAPSALRRYYTRQRSRASARGLALDPMREGDGRPNRALDDPGLRFDADLAWAIGEAQRDDAARNPSRPAPLHPRRGVLDVPGWLEQHFALGRGYPQIAERDGWPQGEVERRIRRALRVVRERLAAKGLLDEPDVRDEA